MPDETPTGGPPGNFYYAALAGAVVSVILIVAVIYYGSQRKKMDSWVNPVIHGEDSTGPDDPNSVYSVVNKGHLRGAAAISILSLIITGVAMLYVSVKSGTLTSLSMTSLFTMALMSFVTYLVIRLIIDATNITPEDALRFPQHVYGAVKSTEINLTIAFAVVLFFTLISAVGHVSTNKAAPAKDETNPGGYINFGGIREESRAMATGGLRRAMATGTDAPAAA